MNLIEDNLIKEYSEWKKANPDSFNWWSYLNMKADLQTALAFAKLFYPDIIEKDNCFILKDRFSLDLFNKWKISCNNHKKTIEKMMNLYEIKGFFHINQNEDEDTEVQLPVFAKVLQTFWTQSFNERFPKRNIKVDVFEEYDELFITVYEDLIN